MIFKYDGILNHSSNFKIYDNKNNMLIPNPYNGKHGPTKKPGLIHFFEENILRYTSSNNQPLVEPNANNKHIIIKMLIKHLIEMAGLEGFEPPIN